MNALKMVGHRLKTFWKRAWWSKIVIVIICLGLILYFWPFLLGGILSFLILLKIKSVKIRWSLIVSIVAVTLFFGSAWFSAMISPSKVKNDSVAVSTPNQAPVQPTQTPQATTNPTPAPSQTSVPVPTPTSVPTTTATPIATPKADSKSSQAKQVSASVFKKFFVDHFDYQQFTKAFGTSDKWEFWESFNPDDDHLILGVTGDDLKSGILKASPNEISSIQIVSFFQMGYPPLVSSGWVENAVSDLKLGDTRQTSIDNVSAKITLTYANIWIVSFIEE